jgi:hypothetical protein
MTNSLLQLATSSTGHVTRRAFLAGTAASAFGFRGAVARAADQLRARGQACILLFMRGAPSQFETFDPKPGTPTGGPTKSIETAVPGLRIAEGWPKTAAAMADMAILRSLTTKEGEHARASYQAHTGYLPAGGVKHPCFGSVAAAELGDPSFELPHFVAIGPNVDAQRIGRGYLAASHAPFCVRPPQPPANVDLYSGVSRERFERRSRLLADLEEDYARAGHRQVVEDHRHVYESARKLVLSSRLPAFDLKQEPAAAVERYGKTPFGYGCLLARRLIETGVTFVEVELNGWDSHINNFAEHKRLSAEADPALAALVADLKDRGRLEKTLVIWMGEFGRTPKINARDGRDHYPQAFSALLAGGGIQGGRVIGGTSADGSEVSERPVTIPDFFTTLCQALSIDPRKEHMAALDRPMKIVEGGSPVKELF